MAEFWCPDCGACEIHHDWCDAFPGEPVMHGNRMPVPAQVVESTEQMVRNWAGARYIWGTTERVGARKPHIYREHGNWKVRCKHFNPTGPYYTFEYAVRAARAIWREPRFWADEVSRG